VCPVAVDGRPLGLHPLNDRTVGIVAEGLSDEVAELRTSLSYPPPTSGWRRAMGRVATVFVLAVVIAVTAFMLITPQTGFPGPGPLHRYKTSQLQDVADRINATIPPGCGLTGASVNWWTGRVDLDLSLNIQVPGAQAWPPPLTSEDQAMVDLHRSSGIRGCIA